MTGVHLSERGKHNHESVHYQRHSQMPVTHTVQTSHFGIHILLRHFTHKIHRSEVRRLRGLAHTCSMTLLLSWKSHNYVAQGKIRQSIKYSNFPTHNLCNYVQLYGDFSFSLYIYIGYTGYTQILVQYLYNHIIPHPSQFILHGHHHIWYHCPAEEAQCG
jgi:hypothetical protein